MISMKKLKLILNSTNLDESLLMVKNLLSITSFLQDDTADMLTKVYHKFLELKYALNSRQTDFFCSSNIEQPMGM